MTWWVGLAVVGGEALVLLALVYLRRVRSVPPTEPVMPSVSSPKGTVDFLFDYMKDSPDRATDQIKSLQGRVGQAFSAATVLIGFAALTTVSPTAHASGATISFLVIAAVMYALAAMIAVRTLRPAGVWGRNGPDVMWRDYRTQTQEAIKVALLTALARDAPNNVQLVIRAQNSAKWVVRFVASEGLAMAVALVLSRLT